MQSSVFPLLRFQQYENPWDSLKLGEVTSVKGGKRLPKGRPFADYKTDYPYIRISDFNDGIFDPADLQYILPEDQKKIARYTISKDNIFISIAGAKLGLITLIPDYLDGALLTENAAKICINNANEISRNYLYYYLNSNIVQKQIKLETAVGGGVPKLAIFRIQELDVKTPSIEEQQKIAAFLGAVDEKIAQLQKKKDLLEDYKKGCMQKLFSQELRFTDDNGTPFPDWEEKELGELISFLSDYTANGSFAALKENVKYYNEENFAVLVRTTDLEKDEFIPQRYTDKRGYDFLKKTSLFGGEIILANVGNIGKVYKAPFYPKPMTLAPNTYVIRFSENTSQEFMYQIMSTYNFAKKVLSLVGGGGLKAINKANLRSVKGHYPQSKTEQQKIADFLSAIDDKIALVAEELDKAKTFKKGLLQQMFV